MTNFPISHVYEVKLPTVSMPRAGIGQINFSVEDKSFSFLMPRRDFEQLGRKIARLLTETPPPSPKRGANLPSNEK